MDESPLWSFVRTTLGFLTFIGISFGVTFGVNFYSEQQMAAVRNSAASATPFLK